MFNLISIALVIGLIVTAAAYLFRSKLNLPPSPVGFPVIGHLHLVKDHAHRCLRDLSKNLGPVFFLRLGSRRAVVVTSASAAEEFLSHGNDVVFANRPIITMGKYVAYNNTTVLVAPYGDHWRNLRRICTVEIFSAARLKASLEIRRDESRSLLRTIHAATSKGGDNSVRVELRPLLSGLTLNVVMRMVAGKRYYGQDNAEAKEVRELIREMFELAGCPYVADFLPILKLFDFDGYIKKFKKLGSKLDKFFQGLVDEHRRNKGKTEFKNTMITHLLTLQESQPEYYTDEVIKGLVEVMIVAGTDSTAVTLEWAMANLLNHPDVLAKVKTELKNVVSREGRLMEESDTTTCTYLNNVISETLRLYPAVPMLLPHLSSVDCKVSGYDIPRDTWLLINAWAIQRDPKLWDEPEAFKPERFDSEELKTYRGKFLPFGIGRRACPGMGLARLVLSLGLGSLIQCFDWEKDEDMAIDMSEGKALNMPKAVPLVAKCKSSPILDNILNLPPSPVGFPVIGHLHLLKVPVHRCLRDLSQNLGPVFLLRLGSCRAVVVTSGSAAQEFLSHGNDVVFANRPIRTMGKYVSYNNTALSVAPYGDHWRNLRRICTLEIFSPTRLKATLEIRRDELRSLLRTIKAAATSEGGDNSVRVELRPLLSGFTLNVVMRMIAGKRCEAKEVRELISETFELAGSPCIADFLPILKLFDFDGHIKKVKKHGSKLDKFLQGLVDDHRRNRGKTEFKNTMITHLLTLQESQPEYYTDEIIKGLVQVMIVAGTDTTAVTLEWAMANLLNHPDVLAKVKTELNNVVSREGRLMEESDTTTCTYLNNVISETLRMYPAGPLLVPHSSSVDCKVAGYDIPRGTTLIINAWAIQRDPKLWDEPEAFKPERFDSEELKTYHGKFLPFGIGRRACPGMGLAQLVLILGLGSLIQCFDWERDEDLAVDMSEGKGLSMPKAVPLVAKCKSSPILDNNVI
ncbi:hypothetical protein Bca52824_031873 [Brassica carinata]|uniref:Cytochrome P450 n=1 Tax=Brassica carinata TaxID=52824 RepID=A0A8X7SBZ9_BRACI|nr:hypothetical protein Bca52824_031873 [Brassica carinata]